MKGRHYPRLTGMNYSRLARRRISKEWRLNKIPIIWLSIEENRGFTSKGSVGAVRELPLQILLILDPRFLRMVVLPNFALNFFLIGTTV